MQRIITLCYTLFIVTIPMQNIFCVAVLSETYRILFETFVSWLKLLIKFEKENHPLFSGNHCIKQEVQYGCWKFSYKIIKVNHIYYCPCWIIITRLCRLAKKYVVSRFPLQTNYIRVKNRIFVFKCFWKTSIILWSVGVGSSEYRMKSWSVFWFQESFVTYKSSSIDFILSLKLVILNFPPLIQ